MSECDEKSLMGLEQGNGITQPLPQATYMYILVYKRQTSEKILNVSVQIYYHYFYTFAFYLNLKKIPLEFIVFQGVNSLLFHLN